MEAVVKSLGEFWGAPGIVCGLQFVAIVYLMKRGDAAQKEHIDTLKANLPLMEKMESTMSTALRVVSRAGGER